MAAMPLDSTPPAGVAREFSDEIKHAFRVVASALIPGFEMRSAPTEAKVSTKKKADQKSKDEALLFFKSLRESVRSGVLALFRLMAEKQRAQVGKDKLAALRGTAVSAAANRSVTCAAR